MIKEHFFRKELPLLLKGLQETAQPQWGIMTPQHMIEHIVGSWRISNGKAKAECSISKETLVSHLKFLYSSKPYVRNMKNPVMPENDLVPLRKKNLKDAVEQLLEEIEDFWTYYEKNPKAIHVHPIFGELDKNGWLTFQEKHIRHHFQQFRLL